MTNDEIRELAKEAGFRWGFIKEQGLIDGMIDFANLVAQHEREACAKIAETPQGEYEVVVACGTEPASLQIPKHLNWQDIAIAIRARGQA